MILGRRMIRVAIIKQAEDSEEGEEDDDDYLLYIDIFVDLESYNDLKNYWQQLLIINDINLLIILESHMNRMEDNK